MTFASPFTGPVDPAYVRFEHGLKTYFRDINKSGRTRWNAKEAGWYNYSADRVNLIEVAVPATDPGSTIDPELDYSVSPWVMRLKISPFGLPELFQKVQGQERKYRGAYGPLVWNPVTGEWRKIQNVHPGQNPQPPPRSTPERCERLLRQVNKLVEQGLISVGEGAQRRQEILRMCV